MSNKYKWITATIDSCTGMLRMDYRVEGLDIDGCDNHDEDVSTWTDNEIKDMVQLFLDVPPEHKDMIQVIWD